MPPGGFRTRSSKGNRPLILGDVRFGTLPVATICQIIATRGVPKRTPPWGGFEIRTPSVAMIWQIIATAGVPNQNLQEYSPKLQFIVVSVSLLRFALLCFALLSFAYLCLASLTTYS